ncbi:hypothetical protein TIFTF001_031006 [Ficus carica]|uniref:Uncharacterized protein n=1 Tax=Ficus carica TaxID=3494 RepID=A0AA88DVI3_FICCA|nr:hypothetical protein TIFTF001_031006 [Ficus carica]
MALTTGGGRGWIHEELGAATDLENLDGRRGLSRYSNGTGWGRGMLSHSHPRHQNHPHPRLYPCFNRSGTGDGNFLSKELFSYPVSAFPVPAPVSFGNKISSPSPSPSPKFVLHPRPVQGESLRSSIPAENIVNPRLKTDSLRSLDPMESLLRGGGRGWIRDRAWSQWNRRRGRLRTELRQIWKMAGVGFGK